MVDLSQQERTIYWALRIKSANDPISEARRMRAELNRLVHITTRKTISNGDKIAFLNEVRSILAFGVKSDDGRIIVAPLDDTLVVDVIDSEIADMKL
jgi:hypothetical protein